MKPVFYHKKARQELEDAAVYYEQQRTRLGDAFEDVILEAEDILSRNPKIGIATSYGDGLTRKYPLPRFPYTLFYRETPERIYIYSIAHDSRKPSYWTDRIEEETKKP